MNLTFETFVQRGVRAALIGAVALSAASCGEVVRTGQSPAFLIINALEGASGADPGSFGTVLDSDVITLVSGPNNTRVPTIFGDPGRLTVRMAMRDPGTPANPSSPSTLNGSATAALIPKRLKASRSASFGASFTSPRHTASPARAVLHVTATGAASSARRVTESITGMAETLPVMISRTCRRNPGPGQQRW